MDVDCGPIDILLLGFDGIDVDPEIWPALRTLMRHDVVRAGGDLIDHAATPANAGRGV